ncbi:hypothetical protein [Ascidiaceihabitans sp.]
MRPEVMGIAFAIVAVPKDLIKRPIADEVGGACSTGIECAKVQLR